MFTFSAIWSDDIDICVWVDKFRVSFIIIASKVYEQRQSESKESWDAPTEHRLKSRHVWYLGCVRDTTSETLKR